MTEKKLYALTDEHVEVLKVWAGYGLYISTDHNELDETADAIHALTPVVLETPPGATRSLETTKEGLK